MKIFIESIPNKFSAYGVHKLADPTSGKSLQKSKYARSVDRIQALYSGKIGGLKNGLSYKFWLDSNGQKKTNEQGRTLTWQDREEQKWLLKEGYLTNRA